MELFKLPSYNTLHITVINRQLILYNIKNNQYTFLKYLLEKGAKIQQSDEKIIMQNTTKDTNPLIIKLITNSIKITSIPSHFIYSDCYQILSLLVNEENINSSNYDKFTTPIDLAINRKEYEIIDLLLTFNPIITHNNVSQIIETHIYSKNMMSLYRLQNFDIAIHLFSACKNNNYWFVAYLFEHYNVLENDATLALHYTTRNINLFVFLLQNGANILNCVGIFHSVVSNPEILEYLIHEDMYDFRARFSTGPPIFTAISNQIKKSIYLLVVHDPKILNARNIYGETPVDMARNSSTPAIYEYIKLLQNLYGTDENKE